MTAPTLTHSEEHAHLVIYTSAQGSKLNIVSGQITNYTPIGDIELIVSQSGDLNRLKFDTLADRDAAIALIDGELNAVYTQYTVNEKLREGTIYSYNPSNMVAPTGTLDAYISVPANTEVYLFVGLTHGGDCIEELYSGTTISELGQESPDDVNNLNSTSTPDSIFSKNPTITDVGTKKGTLFHLGKDDIAVEASSGAAPTFILPEGSYLLRAINSSGYWIMLQHKMQFWERKL